MVPAASSPGKRRNLAEPTYRGLTPKGPLWMEPSSQVFGDSDLYPALSRETDGDTPVHRTEATSSACKEHPRQTSKPRAAGAGISGVPGAGDTRGPTHAPGASRAAGEPGAPGLSTSYKQSEQNV